MAIRLYQTRLTKDVLQLSKDSLVYHSVAGHDLEENNGNLSQENTIQQQVWYQTEAIKDALQLGKDSLYYLVIICQPSRAIQENGNNFEQKQQILIKFSKSEIIIEVLQFLAEIWCLSLHRLPHISGLKGKNSNFEQVRILVINLIVLNDLSSLKLSFFTIQIYSFRTRFKDFLIILLQLITQAKVKC